MKRYFREIIIVITVLLSRLPFIFNSLGIDLDAWREVYTGKILNEDHMYNVSRFPGYPFPEFLYSIVYHYPYWAINLLSVLFTAGCCLYLFKILNFLTIKLSFLIALVFPFVPVIYLNSTIAMEYNWSLFFLLGSVYHLLNKNLWLSALLCGLMVSTRFNNIIFLPAFAFLLYSYSGKDIKKVLQFSVLAFLSICIFFSPVILKYGTGFLQSYGDSEVSLGSLLSLATLYIYGALGMLAIILGVIIQFFSGGYREIKNISKNHFAIFCILMVVSNLAFFVRYPLESGYLTPSVPFVLILLYYVLNENIMKSVLFALLLSPFLIHINAKKIQIAGGIFINENYENQQLKYCNNLIREIKKHSGNRPAIFHVGNYSEQVSFIGNFDKNSPIKIVKYLTPQDQKDIINKKYILYYSCTENGKTENRKTHMLDQYGIFLYKDFELIR
ncbi:ArnT family glycosyltransferase [Chryseobacterium bernardetii]|uniref:ArnT family glycosyltransferase n=1 Tax=Chryseobacterium bernardetii TaxID=1241978 RepID=UPI003AF901A4